MVDQKVRFGDGDAYEQMMGTWSRLVGEVFLDWLALPPGMQGLDVGCGKDAFTELLVRRCAPSMIQGIDPAAAQLSYARARHTAGVAEFRQGDAMARGVTTILPMRRSRKVQLLVDGHIYAQRNRIERCFNKLKNWRRLSLSTAVDWLAGDRRFPGGAPFPKTGRDPPGGG